jgi:hypothetical protein
MKIKLLFAIAFLLSWSHAWASIAIESGCSASSGSGATIACTTGSISAGDVILIDVTYSGGTISTFTDTVASTTISLTPITGSLSTSTQLYPASGSDTVFYLQNASAGAHTITITFSGSVNFPTLTANGLSGVDSAQSIESFSMINGTSNGSIITASSISTVTTNAGILAFGQIGNGSATLSAGSGYTLSAFTPGANVQSEFAVQASLGSYAPTFASTTTGSAWILDAIAVKSAPTSGSLAASPTTALEGSTGNVVTLTCVGCTWTPGTPGSPTFTLSGGTGASITAQHVLTATTATVTITAGTASGPLAVNDPVTGNSALLSIPVASFTVSPTFLINGSTGNTVTLTGVNTAWTSGTVFTVSGVAAAITGQSVPSTTSATLTMNAGGTSGTATITDPSTGNTLPLPVRTPSTWYVRPDGGTRFSSNVTSGQCNGLADASYVSTGALTNASWRPSTTFVPGAMITDNVGFYETTTAGLTSGSGVAGPTWGGTTTTDGTGTWTKGSAYPVNQACAFNDVRMLWQDASFTDGSTFPGWGWIGAGGDTFIVRGSIGTGVTYRVGWDSLVSYCDSTGCWGQTGNPGGSGPPPMLSGVSSQHTKFLGENFASCHSANAKTQLHGGWGVGEVFNVSGSSFVDVACLDITDFSACGQGGQTLVCDSTQDFAQTGIDMTNTTNNMTLTDMHIHGLTKEGVFGPTGGNVVVSYIDILGNGDTGWEADLGNSTTGVGSLLVQHFNISFNGCAEEYPIVDPLPYSDCTDQNFGGGNGDGFGTASINSPSPGWQVHFDQGTVSYNTQDGLDALHIGGPGSTMTDTRVLAYGNMGQQLKVGGATATIQNSIINGNCYAMRQGGPLDPSDPQIPGTPVGFNTNLTDFCRAGNTAILINVTPGDPATYQGNTLYSNGSVGLEVEYASGTPDPADTLLYNDNVFLGFLNTDSGNISSPIFSNTDLNMLTNPGASFTNNSYLGWASTWTCPQTSLGEAAALCTNPGLVDQNFHTVGYGNTAPASNTSAVVGAGVTVSGLPVDFNGSVRPSPPTIGAQEFSTTSGLRVKGVKIKGIVVK